MDAQQLPLAAAMLPQRPIVSPVAQPALTRDTFNARSFGRGTNRLVKEVCGLTGCLRRWTSLECQILLTALSLLNWISKASLLFKKYFNLTLLLNRRVS
jgi:hypothetical protein